MKNHLNLDVDINIIPERLRVNKGLSKTATPLTLDEVINLKNAIIESENPKLIFTFEMVYTYGLELETLHQCTKENYSFENNCFNIDNTIIYVDEYLSNLVLQNPKILSKVERETYQRHVKTMGSKISMDLRWMDLNATREKHLISCPCCNVKVLNDGNLWVVAQRQDDMSDKKWLVCKKCCNNVEEL